MKNILINPVRVQRLRIKGFKLQDTSPNGLPVIYVGRPTKWGNPLKLVGDMIYINASWRRKILDPWVYFKQGTIEDVVKYYDLLLNGEWLGDNEDMRYWNIQLHKLPINELKGKDLACFCSLSCSCHADVLLKRVSSAFC